MAPRRTTGGAEITCGNCGFLLQVNRGLRHRVNRELRRGVPGHCGEGHGGGPAGTATAGTAGLSGGNGGLQPQVNRELRLRVNRELRRGVTGHCGQGHGGGPAGTTKAGIAGKLQETNSSTSGNRSRRSTSGKQQQQPGRAEPATRRCRSCSSRSPARCSCSGVSCGSPAVSLAAVPVTPRRSSRLTPGRSSRLTCRGNPQFPLHALVTERICGV